jgi:hypothetical protein
MDAFTERTTNLARCPALSCTRLTVVLTRVAGRWMTDRLADSKENPGYPSIEQVAGPRFCRE